MSNFHPIDDNKNRNFVPPKSENPKHYIPPYEKMNYTTNRSILFKANELDFSNQIQIKNRFHPLPLLNLDSTEHVGYWSLGQPPQLNNSSIHIPDYQANNASFPSGYYD